jgi:hypothetical protein
MLKVKYYSIQFVSKSYNNVMTREAIFKPRVKNLQKFGDFLLKSQGKCIR